MRILTATALLLLLLASPARADDGAAAIEYLLTAIGESGCTFVRNGKEYSSEDAESHLRMKYRRGKRWATSPEKFIERLASKSSMSGKPYLMRCEPGGEQPTAEWLEAKLADYAAEQG